MSGDIRSHAEGRWHHLEAMQDGEAVSRLSVPDLIIRILGVQIRMGGIGGVETEREHRMKGHARRLLEHAVQYMTGLGQDVSMLFGISDFYSKFGFIPCLPEHCAHVATRDAERAREGLADYRTRPIAADDHGFIVRLYSEDNRSRPAALVRDEETFRGFHKGSDYRLRATGLILEDGQGRRVGYAAFDESQTDVRVTEVNTVDRRAFWTILYEFAKMGVDRRTGHLELHMAADHPFVRFARRYGCRLESHYPRMGAGMMRVLNQDSLFQKLRPALQARLESSEFAGRSVRLTIETDLGTTELHFNGRAGPAASGVVQLGQDRLMQLVVGYRAADDVLSDLGVRTEGEAEALLDAFFGGQSPYVWRADRF